MRSQLMRALLVMTILLAACGQPGSGPGGEFGAIRVTTGYYNSYALLANGTVRAWGQAQHGQLGNGVIQGERYGDPSIDAATPVAVQNLQGLRSIEAGHGAIGAAGSTVFAITESGKVYLWGADDLSPLSGAVDEKFPVEAPALAGAKEIALGLGHACALMGDGTVQCWGNGYSGEMGNGTTRGNKIPHPVPGVTDVVDIAAGSSHVCVVLESGGVLCWGENSSRQVMPAQNDDQLSPVEVPGLEEVVSVGLAGDVSCAVHQDHRMSCWGNYTQEIEIVATDVAQVDGADDHICLRTLDGGVHCWGDNDLGQLGQGQAGEPHNSKRPLAVAGVAGAVDVSVGYEHTCAATDTGEVFCWGTNKYGELGDGTLTDRAAPVAVTNVNSPELPPAENGFQGIALYGEAELWEELPEGCQVTETLDMQHAALLRESFQVQSATARIDSKGMITMRFANYPMIKQGRTIDPRGDQLMATVYFIKVKDPEAEKEERLPADAGDYGISTDTVRYTGAMSGVRNSHTTYELRSGVADDSNIVLSYVGDDWVCGTLNVTNRYGHMKGEFAAAVLK